MGDHEQQEPTDHTKVRRKRDKSKPSHASTGEAPPFIEEIIGDPNDPNTETKSIRYVRDGQLVTIESTRPKSIFQGKNSATGEIVAIKKIYKGGMRAEQLKSFLKAVEVRESTLFLLYSQTIPSPKLSQKILLVKNADNIFEISTNTNRSQTEFNLMRDLNHPNIVRIKGRVEDKFNIYIILEYVNGGSLATYLTKYGTFSPEIAAPRMQQVLLGLAYLHEHNIVHRDIKAANLLITKSGVVKLADFGVSAKLENTAEKRYSVVGTPYWMAPEVISMAGHTGKSDIWSLGCTLLELITGHPPYWDLDQMRAVFCIVQDERPPIPDSITGDLYRFLHKCFVKDPEKRPSAQELLSHPYIMNSVGPTPTQFDAKALKMTLKAYHHIDTSSSNSNPSGFSQASSSAIDAKQVALMSDDLPAISEIGSPPSTHVTPRIASPRTHDDPEAVTIKAAVIQNTPTEQQERDPREPVPTKTDEHTALLFEQHTHEDSHSDNPCNCIIQ